MTGTMRLKRGMRGSGEQYEVLTLVRRYRTMEAASMRLQKEAKGYLDSLRGEGDVTEFPYQH
jgi:hypothetical protein